MPLTTHHAGLNPFSAPPARSKAPEKTTPLEPTIQDAVTLSDDEHSTGQVVGAMAALAVSFLPGAAKAQEKVVVEAPLPVDTSDPIEQALTEPTNCGKKPCKKKEQEKPKWQPLKGQILPPRWTKRHESELDSGWHLSFEAVDVDLRPRWKDGPALKIKGDFLETSLQKTRQLGNGWSSTQGFRLELNGEIRTYDKPQLDLNLQAFRRWEGPLGDDYRSRFDVGVGVRHRFVGQEHQEGLGAGFSMRQEVEGGGFHLWGQDYDWYIEGRQHLFHNLTNGDTDGRYSIMAGPKRDFKVAAFGKSGRLSVAAGPELKGDFNQGVNLGVKAKVKLRL